MTVPAPESWVWLARIRRPQGRKGEVFAELLTDFPEKFAERRQLWLLATDDAVRKRVPRVPRIWGPGIPSLFIRSSSGRTHQPLAAQGRHRAALCRRGFDLRGRGAGRAHRRHSPRRASRAGEDEAYIGDLIGCTLRGCGGRSSPVAVGEIEDVDRTAGRGAAADRRAARPAKS